MSAKSDDKCCVGPEVDEERRPGPGSGSHGPMAPAAAASSSCSPPGHPQHPQGCVQCQLSHCIKPCVRAWGTPQLFSCLGIVKLKLDEGKSFVDLIDNPDTGYVIQDPTRHDVDFDRFVRDLSRVMQLDLHEVYDSMLCSPILPISLSSPLALVLDCPEYNEENASKRKNVLLKVVESLTSLRTVLQDGRLPPELVLYYEAAAEFLVEVEELFSRSPKNVHDAPGKNLIQQLFCSFCKMANVKLSPGNAYERTMNVLGVSVQSNPDARILSPYLQDKLRWACQVKQNPDKPHQFVMRKVSAVIEVQPCVNWPGDMSIEDLTDGLKFIDGDVGSQLLGNMLLELGVSASCRSQVENKERMLGILVQSTKVVFVELLLKSDHYHGIRENDHRSMEQGVMTVSKVYDMLKPQDRVPLLTMLNKISRIVA